MDSNSSAERLANLDLSHAGTENFCLDLIKSSHESSKILVQAANTCDCFETLQFFLRSVACPRS